MTITDLLYMFLGGAPVLCGVLLVAAAREGARIEALDVAE